ncbi:hypothetical protein HNR31_003406 [Anoxybacillus caldiproteolyticus]|uniref:Uncharacterized protein n=1 Tax=Thermaerobacillus caldiproteolyticus TaxID=247480 RepID=A0A7V9Z9I9_9BACL|nr:hypothetical protein [Anoxybacillus caldiproteolyticus]
MGMIHTLCVWQHVLICREVTFFEKGNYKKLTSKQ